MDEGEERRDVIGKGLGRVKFTDRGPKLGCYLPWFTSNNCPPKFKELILWDGEAGCGAEIMEFLPDEEILEGQVPI